MRSLCPLLLSIWLGGVLLAACAADGDLPPVDPSESWRVIAVDSATSTCIGSLSDPVCAVETLMACRVRLDSDLCRISQTDRYVPDFSRDDRSRRRPLDYRIVELRHPIAEDSDGFGDDYADPLADDVVVGVKINWSGGGASDDRSRYLVRKMGQSWKVVGGYEAHPGVQRMHWPDTRFLTDDPATSTSTCIGTLADPVCAAETHYAGLEWQNKELRNFALGRGPLPPKPWYKLVYRQYKARYRVTGQRHPNLSDAAIFEEVDAETRPDDWVVEINDPCARYACTVVDSEPLSYLVRRQGGSWVVAAWNRPRPGWALQSDDGAREACIRRARAPCPPEGDAGQRDPAKLKY